MRVYLHRDSNDALVWPLGRCRGVQLSSELHPRPDIVDNSVRVLQIRTFSKVYVLRKMSDHEFIFEIPYITYKTIVKFTAAH
jgi:hypothetical protein